MELYEHSGIELHKKIMAGEVSVEEVIQAHLQRIADVDGRQGTLDYGEDTEEDKTKVHAFITVTAEQALEKARQLDKQIAAGEKVGPMAGIPFTAKDVFCTKDVLTSAASRMLHNFYPPYSSTPLRRLEDAGAIMLGKVNLDEFTYGSSTESTAYQPTTRNPWDLSRVPGGSSGGSTASVAAYEAPISLGTDTGGSIRHPSSFCGVVGLKPTYGRVSRYGLIPLGSSLDCPGTISRTVADTAQTLQIMAGADPQDSTAVKLPVPDYLAQLEEGVKGKRIGLSPEYFKVFMPDGTSGKYREYPVQAEFEKAVYDAAERLARMGAEIVENVPMPHMQYGVAVYFVISRVETSSNLHRFDGVRFGYQAQENINDFRDLYKNSRREGFGLQPKLRLLMGMYVNAAQFDSKYYRRAMQVRGLIRGDFDKAFDPQGPYRIDALLTPTTPSTAFPVGDVYGDSVLMQYTDQLTVCANHAGVPAINVPAGLSEEGLPVGIDFIGKDFDELGLLQMARAYEIATQDEPWRKAKPRL